MRRDRERVHPGGLVPAACCPCDLDESQAADKYKLLASLSPWDVKVGYLRYVSVVLPGLVSRVGITAGRLHGSIQGSFLPDAGGHLVRAMCSKPVVG